MKPDAISILESAYAPAPSLDAWLARLVAAAGPVLDRGFGAVGGRFTLDDLGRVALAPSKYFYGNASPDLVARSAALVDALNDDAEGRRVLARVYPRAPVAGLFSALSSDAWPTDALQRLSTLTFDRPVDAFGVIGAEPSGHGVVLAATTDVSRPPGARERLLLTRVATHLASAYRLQRDAPAAVDAVLHPDGRVAHAEPAAQAPASLASLRAETRAMDTARGRLRRADPDEALAMWKALVSGQWSLVDQVDTDGRRYVFARRNAPVVRSWDALSERERQVVAYAAEGLSCKAIAYALGIRTATVSTHLRRAAQKVGVDSRLALVRAFNARTAP